MEKERGLKRFSRRAIAGGVALSFLVLACATPVQKERQFEFLSGDYSNIGEEARKNPRILDRLFGLPAEFYMDHEKESQEPGKSWLGIFMKDPEQPVRDPDSHKEQTAIEVVRVLPFSPAEQAGLERGDFIVALNGEPLVPDDKGSVVMNFKKSIEKFPLSDVVKLSAIRDDRENTFSAKLHPQPKASVKMGRFVRKKDDHENSSESLLHYLLRKEGLVDHYRQTVKEIRDRTADIVSMMIKTTDYNPFRLRVVNHLMHRPMELPSVSHEITENLHDHFNKDTKRPVGLVAAGMEKLDFDPVVFLPPNKKRPERLVDFIQNLMNAIALANKGRSDALSSLTASEINILLEEAQIILSEDPEEEAEEKTEEEKKQIEEHTLLFLKTALKVDLPGLLQASADIATELDIEFLLRFKADSPTRLDGLGNDWIVTEKDNLTVIQTPAGKILIGGTGDNLYTEEAVLILDLGGNDRYLNRAGGSSLQNPFAVVIDFSGDDLYSWKGNHAQGAGVLGGGFLIDLEGNDRYSSRDYSQGAGVFGVGMLIDLAGHDEYKAESAGQGAGVFGIGLLAEGAGNDVYFATRFAQGFGFTQGFGAVVEAGGDDKYFAGGIYPDNRDPKKSYQSLSQGFGFGLRPFDSWAGTSGGIGIIAEAEGNDTYVGDYFSQGSSYWYALGILSDKKGHDKYIAGRYSQGAGIHLTAGILVDGEGDDHYLAYYGVSQGCGHDLAIGFLLDHGGNDRYVAGVLSQGAGNDNGIGLLNDNGGDDEYYIEGMGHGSGNFLKDRGLGSFGIQFDTGGGKDFYSPGGKNNHLIYKTDWGVFADTN